MLDQIQSAIARILCLDGTVVGTGFLVSERHVLTCAHVVSQALELPDDTPEKPADLVHLEFPFRQKGKICEVRVEDWEPIRDDGGGDMALLELAETPPDCRPIRLVQAQEVWGHGFCTYGFPINKDTGVYADGELRGRDTGGWVQIENSRASGYRIQPGFSGAPLWDMELGGVIGMIVAAERDETLRVAYIIPTDILTARWPALERSVLAPCPYRGLMAFREEDAQNFFGRDAFVERLRERVKRRKLIAVTGPSGGGKSSVVYAGLVPQLRAEGWLVAHLRPGERPFRALSGCLLPHLEPELPKVKMLREAKQLAQDLECGELELHEIAEGVFDQNPEAAGLLVVVDQFEELYTVFRNEDAEQERLQRRRFLELLMAKTEERPERRLVFVLTIRADFFEFLIRDRDFGEALEGGLVSLMPLKREELEQVIVAPARRLGVDFEEGLVSRMLDSVEHAPGALPLLQFALTLLWEMQRLGRITHQTYEEIGGVEQSIAREADEFFEALSESEQRRVRRIFPQLVLPGREHADTKRRATEQELSGDMEMVSRLAGQRLIVIDQTDEGQTVEVAHEALIRHWSRLHEWLEEDRDFRRWQERMRAALALWLEMERNNDALLHGMLLMEAETHLHKREAELSPAERDYIRAGVRFREREEERLQRREMEALELSAHSLAKLRDGLGALRDAVRALRLQRRRPLPDWEVRAWDLLSHAAHEVQEGERLEGHEGEVNGVAFAPDGRTIASASDDKTVRIWGRDGECVGILRGHESYVNGVAFSPDGDSIASASDDETVRIWSREGECLLTLRGHESYVFGVAFSPDGQMIASSSDDKSVGIWNRKGECLRTLRGHESHVYSAAFSPDGDVVASVSADRTVRIWNREGECLRTLRGHEEGVWSLAFSPDGDTIASASADRTLRIWNREGECLRTLRGHEDSVLGVAFSPDGQAIVSASDDKTVRIWNREGECLLTLRGHSSRVIDAAFSPDGKAVASASGDKSVRIWNREGDSSHTLRGHESYVIGVAFSPKGDALASASWDKTVRIWSREGECLRTLGGHEDLVIDVAFSPDGNIIASASVDGTVRIWNREGECLRTLRGHEDRVYGVAFEPDGDAIASASYDKTVRIWNREGDCVRTLRGHESHVLDVAFSPDGETLASSSFDKTVRLWNRNGECLRILRGHGDRIYGVAFSPDGDTVASASFDKTVRLWNRNGECFRTLRGHEDRVMGVAFSPDGDIVASASPDKAVRLWCVSDKALASFVRKRLENYLRHNPNVPDEDRNLLDELGF